MATVHEITSVATKLTTSDGELWAILLPSLIASIVPTAAVVFTFLQSRESTKLAREQAKATNEVARRQVEIAARQADLADQHFISENFDRRFESWRLIDNLALEWYRFTMGAQSQDSLLSSQFLGIMTRYTDAKLRLRFLFRDDAVQAAEALYQAVNRLHTLRVAMLSPNHDDPIRIEAVNGGFAAQDQTFHTALDSFREVVRRYTVHGVSIADRVSTPAN